MVICIFEMLFSLLNYNVIFNMKKIFIYAYTELNLGDDLFIKMLCERYSQTNFYILCRSKYAKGIKKINNLTVIHRILKVDGLLEKMGINLSINRAIERFVSHRCDGSVTIGGSLFMENGSWKKQAHQFSLRVVGDKPSFLIGSNFGPYQEDEFRAAYMTSFRAMDDVCFRDTYSTSVFPDVPTIRHAPDVVFAFKLNKNVEPKKKLLISVVDLSHKKNMTVFQEQYLNKLVEIIRFYLKRDYNVCLMSFCEREGDRKAIQQILDKMDTDISNKVEVYNYHGDISGAINQMSESSHIIASRFHAMILGFVLNRAVLPIPYSEKFTNVLNDFDFTGNYINMKDINMLLAQDVWDYFQNYKIQDIASLKEKAEFQFNGLDFFLGKN